MNLIDIIIVLCILMFGVIGLKRGVIKEGVSFVGILLVFIISYTFKGVIGNELCKMFPFFPLGGPLEGLVSANILIYQLIGFCALYSILMLAYHIIMFLSKIIQKMVNATVILTLPSAILGAVVGLIKGYLIAFIVLLVLSIPIVNMKEVNDSSVRNFILYDTPVVSTATKDISSSMNETAELIEKIQKKSITTNDANLQLLKTMLKYNVIDKHTLEQLIVLDKLDSVKGVESLVKD